MLQENAADWSGKALHCIIDVSEFEDVSLWVFFKNVLKQTVEPSKFKLSVNKVFLKGIAGNCFSKSYISYNCKLLYYSSLFVRQIIC